MVNLNLCTRFFTEEETKEMIKGRLIALTSIADNDLVELAEDSEDEEPFVDWFVKENEELLKDCVGLFLEKFLKCISEHMEKNNPETQFEYTFINDELSYGYVVSVATAYN